MVLIEVRNSEGLVGRCDARCYNAKEPHCECICGGRNHGAGLQRAIENTREQAEQWIGAYAERLGLAEYEATVAHQVHQMSLFELIAELAKERQSMKTLDVIHQYKPYRSGIEAHCRLRVYEHQGSTVAVLSEPPDNPGMSVTNAAEWLLPRVAQQYGLPAETIWIEHWQRQQGEPDTYDLITLTSSGSPAWRRLSATELAELLPADTEPAWALAPVQP